MDPPPCCPPGSWPQALLQDADALNKDEPNFSPKGSVVTLSDSIEVPMPVYVVDPPGGVLPTGVMVVLQDIFSVRVLHPTARSGDRLGHICDYFAETLGYTVAMPSLFRDDPVDFALAAASDDESDPQKSKIAWLKKQSYAKTGPDLKATIGFLQTKCPGLPICVVGFCYGAWLLSKASPEVSFACAVGCHPSTKNETLQGGDELAMLSTFQQPTLFLCAGNDSDIFKNDGAGKKALEKSGGGVEEYPDMLHGWVCRGDTSDESIKQNVEKALASVQDFVRSHIKP